VQKLKIALEFSQERLYDYMMTNAGKRIICLLASLSICASSRAVTPDSSDNPYHGIVDRNVFGLKPPPPPPDPEANKPPPPKIILAGIMGGFGAKKALMKTTPPAKPGEPAKEQSYILAVGQREDDLEVLDINEKAGSVKVKYGGVELPLTFDNNGVKLAAGPPPAVAPGVPPPGGGAAHAGGNPFAPNPGGFNKTIPTRPMRPGGGNSGVTPQSTGAAYPGGTPYTAGNGLAVPTPGLAVAPGQPIPAPGAQQQQQPELTGEQATVLVELERERLKQQGSPLHDLMPPTELSPNANVANPGGTPGATTPGATPGATTPGLPIPGPRRPGGPVGPFPQ